MLHCQTQKRGVCQNSIAEFGMNQKWIEGEGFSEPSFIQEKSGDYEFMHPLFKLPIPSEVLPWQPD